VHFPGSGWHALDATAWVPRHPDSPPDSIAAGAGEPFPDDDGEPAPEAKAAAEGGVPSRPSRLGDGGRAPPSGAPLPAADAAARRRVPGDSAAATPANGESDAIEWLRFGAWEEGGPRRAARRVEDGGAWAPDAAARRGQPLDAAASGDAPERRFGAATLNSVKRPLRMLLIALAMVALLLVWISFRRSKRRAEEKEKEAVDDGDGDAETGAGAAADAADFEFDAGDPRQAIIGGYHRLQADLAPFEQARKPWQTPAEHGRELSRRFSGLRDAAARLVELFHRALYGARAVGEKERRDFEAQDRRIRRRLR
jgi:cbb3-type cytochrome oxidase subunit 3